MRGGVPVERVTQIYDLCLAEIAGTLDNLAVDDPDGAVAAVGPVTGPTA